ncbi:MAG TPA: rod shape-determining protein, partial [Candidatus Nitrosotenuis sp.]|nr:rod shape-determining protein [Candidatus Nitrosotenuis sp.]
IDEPEGKMVVDIGGGTSDVAVVASGGMVVSEAIRAGGNALDEAIARLVRRKYNLMIGERTAEALKIALGSAFPGSEPQRMEISGRDLVDGLPRGVVISDEEVREAVEEPVLALVEAVKRVLERTPPELSADLLSHGIVLTGGGAQLRGLDQLLARTTGVPVRLAQDPASCVAIGTGLASRRLAWAPPA